MQTIQYMRNQMHLYATVAAMFVLGSADAGNPQPNLVFVLVDDLGWNGVGYHNPEVNTPTIDRLASSGLKIDGFYTYKVCAPARASFLTGRFPFHLAATKTNFAYFWTLEGTNLTYTMFPEKLQKAGYKTHMVGKWHQGFYAPQYLPTSRGFDSYLGFLSGCEDHLNQLNCCGPCNQTKYGVGKVIDLFGGDTVGPAYADSGKWNGYTFTDRAVDVIENHAVGDTADAPLFLYMALHNTHAPFEVPEQYSSLYNYSLPLKNTWAGMVSMVDETLANVTRTLQSTKLWRNTLLVMAGDNGSPVCGWGAAGSNHPLRGSKASNWEGGVHTFAFAAGGFLPAKQVGKTLSGMIHICDFYKTFLAMASGDGTDAGGPAPLDSLDQSGYLLGRQTSSARTVIVHDHYCVKCLPSEPTDHANVRVKPTSEFNESLFRTSSTVTLETFYSGGGCHEHFGDHFWLKTADLKAIGLPSKGSNVGALTMNGFAINIAHMGPSQAGSGCVGCCSGCPLTIFQIRPFNIGSLNLHPGSNVTISFSTTPVPPPPPPPPSPLATGAIRVGDWKLLIGPQHDATWFGMFSPNASFNATAAAATACEKRPCLFNIARDPNEHEDLADSNQSKAAELLEQFYTYNKQYHPGAPIGSDHDGYCAAAEAHRGFMVPWRAMPDRPQLGVIDDDGMRGGDPMERMTERQRAAFVAGGGL